MGVTALLLLAIAVLAVQGYSWYRRSIRKWTWETISLYSSGAQLRLGRRYEARYPPDVLANCVAAGVIARLLPLEQGVPYTADQLNLVRRAPPSAVDEELRRLDLDEAIRLGLVYALYGIFQLRLQTDGNEAAMAFLADVERKGLRWRDIPMPPNKEFLEGARPYFREAMAIAVPDPLADLNKEMSQLNAQLRQLAQHAERPQPPQGPAT